MIVEKETKLCQVRNDILNRNWTEQDCYVVDETTEEGKALSLKIMVLAPYMDFITDDNDNLIDVVSNGLRPIPEPEEPELEEDLAAMAVDQEYRLTLLEMGVL